LWKAKSHLHQERASNREKVEEHTARNQLL